MPLENIVTLEEEGKELQFRVRQMSALEMESWLVRAAEIFPPEQAWAGSSPTDTAGRVLRRGVLALACTGGDKAAALLEEMLRCCVAVDERSGAETPCTSQNIDNIINNVRTLTALRSAALHFNLAFALEGARKPLQLPRDSAFRRAVAEQSAAQTANVPQVTASLISQGAASLNELRTVYSYSDALDLLEIVNVRNYNQWFALETAKRKRR